MSGRAHIGLGVDAGRPGRSYDRRVREPLARVWKPLAQWAREHCGWRLETAPGLTGSGGFTTVPTRWVVERSISWLQWDRRLSRDYECETAAAEATIFLSSIRHLIRKF